MLNIEKELNEEKNGALVKLIGRLDTMTAPNLEKELNEFINNLDSLIIDMEKLEYISSAGLRVLLASQKVMNKRGNMKVIHVNDMIMEIFDVTGFSDILTIEK